MFNNGTDGFVIIAGDDNVTPVLGYSDEGAFNPENIPLNMQEWLEGYKSQIRYVIENEIEATAEIRQEWHQLLNPSQPNLIARTNTATYVAPLITTKWDQSPHFNALCPYDNTENQRTVTGCVATAMAQVMKYWNHPTTGTGSHSYTHPTYGTLSANFGSTTYQWNSMPNRVTSANSAVATLMYHCGVSVEMDYGVAASGANTLDVVDALKNYFGYSNSVEGKHRRNYGDAQWVALLKNELDSARPIQYAATGSDGGHSFVCDGYDNNGYFHMNWGWSGNSDGYFPIDALNPSSLGTGGGSGGFNTNHRAIIGIKPASAGEIPQNYILRLSSNITIPTQVWFGSSFNLSVNISNSGTGSFSGQIGAAVFDSRGNFVDFMATTSATIQNGSYTTISLNNPGSISFIPGTYHVVMFYKTTSQTWTIVGNGNYTNVQQFQVYYSSAIEVNSAFSVTTNGGRLIQGQSATINVDVLNTGSSTFYGQFRLNLLDQTGSSAQSIQVYDVTNGLQPNHHYTNGINFTGNITVAPGTYLLSLAYKPQDGSSWYFAGSSNFSNPIRIVVEGEQLPPDPYEDNNTPSAAYVLPLSFSGNTATVATTGANFHTGNDVDNYKINLPSGYNYTISARLHDSYNSGNGNTYTADAKFFYFIDGGTDWSEAYDDVMPSDINIQNGGRLYLYVAPYYPGVTGTYLLDIQVTRTPSTGIDEPFSSQAIKVYPNPAKEFVVIDLNEFTDKVNSISLINIQGQQISSTQVAEEKSVRLELHGLPDGVYFIQIDTEQGVLTKKLVVGK